MSEKKTSISRAGDPPALHDYSCRFDADAREGRNRAADPIWGDRPKTPQPGTITNIGIAYIAFADIHSLLKEFF